MSADVSSRSAAEMEDSQELPVSPCTGTPGGHTFGWAVIICCVLTSKLLAQISIFCHFPGEFMMLPHIFLDLLMDFVCWYNVLFKCVYPQGFSYVCVGKEGKA